MTFTPALISSLAPLKVTPQGGSSTVLPCEMVGMTWGIKHQFFRHSGNVYATANVIPGADRRVRLSIPFYAAFEVFGLSLTQLSAMALYLAAFADFNRESGSNHQMMSLSAACVAGAEIVGWTVSQDGILFATCDVVFLSSDGATDPITITDSQALPSVGATPLLHTVGPVSFAGSIIPGVSSSGGSMGTSPMLLRTDGDLFGRSGARIMADPTITLMHSDPKTLIDNITQMGATIAYNTIVYFKSYDATTGESSTANGLSISLSAGNILPHGVDANQGEVATAGVDLLGISADGAGNPLSVSTGVTVPTPP
jgi:hypothetical protein